MLLPLLIAASSSSGCATERNSPPQIFCPLAPTYTKDFQNRVADELVAHPDLSAIPAELEDYTALRDKLRTCNAPAK